MRLDGLDASVVRDRLLDALGLTPWASSSDEALRELEVQRHARAPVVLEDRDVVGLLDQRLGERGDQDVVAQLQAPAARLDVDDDVACRQRRLDRVLDLVGGRVALDDGAARRAP